MLNLNYTYMGNSTLFDNNNMWSEYNYTLKVEKIRTKL